MLENAPCRDCGARALSEDWSSEAPSFVVGVEEYVRYIIFIFWKRKAFSVQLRFSSSCPYKSRVLRRCCWRIHLNGSPTHAAYRGFN